MSYQAIFAIAALLGGSFLLCGAVSAAENDTFNPFNQVYTDSLLEGSTFTGWFNQVDPADYHSRDWFTQPQRDFFNQTEVKSFATIDPETTKMMDDALKNFLKKKTTFAPLGGGPAYIWCSGGY